MLVCKLVKVGSEVAGSLPVRRRFIFISGRLESRQWADFAVRHGGE